MPKYSESHLTLLQCSCLLLPPEGGVSPRLDASEETTVSIPRIVMLRYFNLFFKLYALFRVEGKSADYGLFSPSRQRRRLPPSDLATEKSITENVYCFYWHYTYQRNDGWNRIRQGKRVPAREFISLREIGSRSPHSAVESAGSCEKNRFSRGGSVKWIF